MSWVLSTVLHWTWECIYLSKSMFISFHFFTFKIILWELHNSSKPGCLLGSQLELWDLTPITKGANCSFTMYRIFFFGKGQKIKNKSHHFWKRQEPKNHTWCQTRGKLNTTKILQNKGKGFGFFSLDVQDRADNINKLLSQACKSPDEPAVGTSSHSPKGQNKLEWK